MYVGVGVSSSRVTTLASLFISDIHNPLSSQGIREERLFYTRLGCGMGVCSSKDVTFCVFPVLQKSLLHLIKFLLPSFHDYVTSIEGGHHLIFTHRWLLVNFKREFSIEDTLRIWETCWACSECNSFHLLVCLAIIAMYGNKPIIQNMSSDELMIHFSGLAHSMSVDVVLSQARGLLHTLCTSKTPLPQDLSDLMITDLSHEALIDIV